MRLFFLLSVFFLFSGTFADSLFINREEFMRRVWENDKGIKSILAGLSEIGPAKTISEPSEDIVLSVNQGFYLDFDGNAGPEHSSSLSYLFPYSGSSASVSFNYSDERPLKSELGISYSADLVRNRFGRQAELKKLAADVSSEISRTAVTESCEDYAEALAGLYLEWQLSYFNMISAESLKETSLRLFDYVVKMKNSRIADESDFIRAELQVLDARQRLADYRNIFKKLTERILSYSGAGQTVLFPDTVVPPIPEEGVPGVPDVLDSIRTFRALDLVLRNDSVNIEIARDNLLPAVKGYAGYGLAGLTEGPEAENNKINAGASFSWNFNRKKDEASLALKLAQREISDFKKASGIADVRRELKTLSSEMDSDLEMIAILKEKSEAASRLMEETEREYARGRATLKDLIEVINSLENYRIQALRYRFAFLKERVRFLSLSDNLLKKLPKIR